MATRSGHCRRGENFRSGNRPPAAAQAYRDRIVGPVRGELPKAVVKGLKNSFLDCTTEIAAFDEFTALLTDTRSPPVTTTSFSIPLQPATLSACATSRRLERFSGGGKGRRLSRPARRIGSSARDIERRLRLWRMVSALA